MKKLPRSLSGQELIRILKKLGYTANRQVGSHIRLTTEINGIHHITIPDHAPLKIGTLSGILKEVAGHHGFTKEELFDLLL